MIPPLPMKTKVKTNKLPRARIMYTDPGFLLFYKERNKNLPEELEHLNVPVLVLPQPSLSAAKKALALVNKYGVEALLKEPSQWAKLGEEEKVEAIARLLEVRAGYTSANPFLANAEAILQLLGKGAKG